MRSEMETQSMRTLEAAGVAWDAAIPAIPEFLAMLGRVAGDVKRDEASALLHDAGQCLAATFLAREELSPTIPTGKATRGADYERRLLDLGFELMAATAERWPDCDAPAAAAAMAWMLIERIEGRA